MKIMRETWIMGAICLFDLIFTVWLIGAKLAVEANPIMLALLNLGLFWFVAFKCAYTFGPLALLEWVGRRHQNVVRKYLRLGIALYVGLHLVNATAAVCAAQIVRHR